MKKAFKIVYSVIFLLICMFPLVFMPFVKNDTSLEKRELNKFPAYMEKGRLNVDFSTQFEAWLNDRIPFRPELLSAANLVKGELLHASTSNVIVGKDGWLYYQSESRDYMDSNRLSDAQVNAAAVTLSLIQENIEAKGGHFLFVPMPNKASVYGEKMPSAYRKAEENNLSRVMAKVKELDVHYVDMQAVLTEQKDKGLYHRRDSHWNYQGALIGYNAMMDALPRDHKTYSDAAVSKKNDWRGDLDKLLYPAGGVMDDQYYYDIQFSPFLFTYPASTRSPKEQLENFMSDKEEGDDLIKAKNNELKDGSRLYMARDSFGRAILPYMIDNYEESTFKRTDCPDVNSIEENTDFIYEIVERNLNRLSEKAPFMYAPAREADKAAGSTDAGELQIYCDVEGYGVRLYGALPGEKVAGDGRVYILLEQNGESQVFEAFPIYEKELMAEKKPDAKNEAQNGFSAILERTDALAGTYQVSIIAGGQKYQAGSIEVK